MTIKSRGPGDTSDVIVTYNRNRSGCGVVGNTSVPTLIAREIETMIGTETPNFHRRVKRGELLPYTYWKQYSSIGSILSQSYRANKISSACKTFPTYWNDGPYDRTGTAWALELIDLERYASEAGLDTNELVQAAAANIYSRFDALTFLAEVHQIRAMLRGVVRRFISLIERRRYTDIWLELRYGWRPLLADMAALVDAVNSIEDKRERHKMRVGNSSVREERFEVINSGGSSGYTTLDVITHVTVSARGSIIADAKLSAIQMNPVVTTWEVVPYSFVIDWVVSVGAWIKSMSLLFASSGYTAAGGIQVDATRTVEVTGNYPSSGWTHSVAFQSHSIGSLTERVPTTIPNRPIMRGPVGPEEIIDLIQLIQQALRKTRRR